MRPTRPSDLPRGARAVLLLATALAGACGGDAGTEPAPTPPVDGRPAIELAGGAGASDTVNATLATPLRIVVRDARGRAVPRTTVRLTALQRAVGAQGTPTPTLLVSRVGGFVQFPAITDTTADDGSTSARIVLGGLAGEAGVIVEVPAIGITDTALFVVRPGNPARILLLPLDTALTAGGSYQLTAAVRDRLGNARTDSVLFRTSSEGAGVSPRGLVATTRPARAAIVATVVGRTLPADTAWVSVVPEATVAVRHGGRLALMRLDGSAEVLLPLSLASAEPSPEWHPDGQSLLATLAGPSGRYTLYRVGLTGSLQPLIASGTSDVHPELRSLGHVRGFAVAPDGRSVYVSTNGCNYNAVVYRVPLQPGDTITRISPEFEGVPGWAHCDTYHHFPSPSPDGGFLVIERRPSPQGVPLLGLHSLQSGVLIPMGVEGERPAWSPDGGRIAYTDKGRIWIAGTDGSAPRALSAPGRDYAPGLQWSPDGRWLLARFHPEPRWVGTTVALVDVATGLELPLAFTRGHETYGLPDWRPRD